MASMRNVWDWRLSEGGRGSSESFDICISSLAETRLSRFSKKTAEKFVGPKKPPDLMKGPPEAGDRISLGSGVVCETPIVGEAIDAATDGVEVGVGSDGRLSLFLISVPGGEVV